MNSILNTTLINQLTGYYEKAKKRVDLEKNNFQEVKESFETQEPWVQESVFKSEAKTLEEFKKEVYDIIDSVPITGLAGSSIVINISDAAFEKMMSDEKFMKVELGALIRDLGWPPTQMYNPAYVVFEISAEEGYKGTSYGSAHKSTFESKSENSFWEKRKKKFRENMEELQEYYYNKKLKMKKAEMKRLEALSVAKKIAVNKGNPFDYERYMPSLFSAADLLDDIIM